MLPRPLTNFEIQKYYQNEPRINDVYLRNDFPISFNIAANSKYHGYQRGLAPKVDNFF